MNLAILQYYRTVCETGSMAKAAEQLFLSRQALSKSILTLEDAVGVKLCRRKSSGIELTPAGEILYRHTKVLLRDWNKALEELEPLKWEQNVCLRVGYGQMAYNLWEVGHVETFAQIHPEVRMSYEIHPPEQLVRRLEDGQLDLIISSDSGDGKTTFSVLLRRLPHYILLRQDDPLSQNGELYLKDLAHHPIFLNPARRLSENIQKAFLLEGIEADFRPFPSHDPLTLLRTICNTGAIYFDSKLHFLYRDLMEGLTVVPFRYEGPLGLASLNIQATALKAQQENRILQQYIYYLSQRESWSVQRKE